MVSSRETGGASGSCESSVEIRNCKLTESKPRGTLGLAEPIPPKATSVPP